MKKYCFVLLCTVLLSTSTLPRVLGQGEPSEERLVGDSKLGCSAVAKPLNSCLARWTGNAQITIQLIADYALQIYEFLFNNVNFTSLLQFLQIVEQNVDPEVSTAQLRCECTKPANETSQFPWNCTSTVEGDAGESSCLCLNNDDSTAFCEIYVDCPSDSKAVGGRCNNNVAYASGKFHFDDVGFGIPLSLQNASIPLRTECNTQVSREEDFVDIFASAYCKPV